MPTKILYVCTYWGVRSQIARLTTDALELPDLVAESAGFESGTIGPLPRQIMNQRGLDLAAESPATLFAFARKKTDYDYVITLCNHHTQENYQVLYNVVDMMFGAHSQVIHWNVPDFMSIKASGSKREIAAEKIVDDIQSNVYRFVEELDEKRRAAR